MNTANKETDLTGSNRPVLLSQEYWDLAAVRMPDHETKFVIMGALINDINQRNVDGRYCVVVFTDIVNYYPDRVGEIDEALLETLQNFPIYLAQEIAGIIAGRFDEFPFHKEVLKRQQLQHIRDVLSAYATPQVTGPNHLL